MHKKSSATSLKTIITSVFKKTIVVYVEQSKHKKHI